MPTCKDLKQLKLELQANASSAETDLGVRNHRYLVFALTDAEYASINGSLSFAPPAYPGSLIIPISVVAIEALQLKDEYHEARQLYLECKNVEKTLQRHAQDALSENAQLS